MYLPTRYVCTYRTSLGTLTPRNSLHIFCGFREAAGFVDAVPLHHWGWQIFGVGGLWRWPLLVEANFWIAEAACFGARPQHLLRAKILVDSVATFGELCGVGLGGGSTLAVALRIVQKCRFLAEAESAFTAGLFWLSRV